MRESPRRVFLLRLPVETGPPGFCPQERVYGTLHERRKRGHAGTPGRHCGGVSPALGTHSVREQVGALGPIRKDPWRRSGDGDFTPGPSPLQGQGGADRGR